jgi:hypothetical protein
MATKILHWLGLAAAITLIIACFLPWTFHADVKENFTGFHSFKNTYGSPSKFLLLVGVAGFVFILLPKVWAKRVNLFLAALGMGYAIKTFVLYTGCYYAYCPQKLMGLYIMLISSVVLMLAAIFPNLKVEVKKEN